METNTSQQHPQTNCDRLSDGQRLFGSSEWKTEDTYDNDFGLLPNGPGVYAFVHVDYDLGYRNFRRRVLYVGMSTNLRNRVKSYSHHVGRIIRGKFDYVQTWFKPCDASLIRQEERRLIELFDAPYNIVGRRRGL